MQTRGVHGDVDTGGVIDTPPGWVTVCRGFNFAPPLSPFNFNPCP